MRKQRLFHVTTAKSPDGVVYGYDVADGTLAGLRIKSSLSEDSLNFVLTNIKPTLETFLKWAETVKGLMVVELAQQITFEMFWNKYNDKARSSKKRSEKLWKKLPEEEQVKAHYYIETYNRNRGNAEKKYCETYLTAEQWNN